MKKYFYLMALCLPFLLLASCGSDDDDNESGPTKSEIIGTWVLKEVADNANGPFVSWPYERTTATFNANGTYTGTGKFGNGSGTWKQSGNTIETYINGQLYFSYEIISVSGNKAELKMSMDGSSLWIRCEKG